MTRALADDPGGTGHGVIDDPSNGSTYTFSWITGAGNSGAATASIETSSGSLSAYAAGIGATIALSIIPVTIDPNSTATVTGNMDTVTLLNNAVGTNTAGNTNAFVCSPFGQGNASDTATVTGAATTSCTIENNAPDLSVNAQNGTSVVVGANQLATLICGNDTETVTGTGTISSVCSINPSTNVRSWADAGSHASITSSGTGNFSLTGNYDTLTSSIAQAAGSITIDGNYDAATLAPNAFLTISGANNSALLEGAGVSIGDATSGLTVSDASGVSAGASMTLLINNLNVVDNLIGNLSVGDASGISNGNITMGAGNGGITDYAYGGSLGISGSAAANITMGINNLSVFDSDSGRLSIADATGISNPTITMGAGNGGIYDQSVGGFLGISGSAATSITMAINNLSVFDSDSGRLSIADATGISNPTITTGTGNGGLYDQSVGGFLDISGSAATNITMAINNLSVFDSSAAALSIADATGISNPNVTMAAGNGGIIDNAIGGALTLSGTAGAGVTLGVNNLTLTSNVVDLSVQTGSGVSGGILNFNQSGDNAAVVNAKIDLSGNLTTTIVGVGNSSGDTINAPGTDDHGAITVGAAGGTDIVNWAGGNGVGAGSWTATFNYSQSEALVIADWTAASGAGTLIDQLTDWTAGGSQLSWYNPETGVSSVIGNFTQANEGGNLTSENLYTTNGYAEDFTFEYSGNEYIGATEKYYDGNSYLGYADFNADGQETGGEGEVGGYGSYEGGYDFAGAGKSKGQNIAKIAAYDLGNDHLGAAAAAARFQSQLTSLAPASAGVLAPGIHAARWTGGTITWALATGAGSGASPFSGRMSASYLSAVQKAFAAWAKATGLQFVEVAAGKQSDIRIGWGTFDSATSDVLGYTSARVKAGVFQSGAEIRLEDPSETALVTNGAGQLAYAGTDAEFEQVLLHEIGHAIGLGDSADPNSIMNAAAGPQDRSITNSDIAAVEALYAAAAGASTAVASSAFAAPAGVQISPVGVDHTPRGQVTVLTGSALTSAMDATRGPTAAVSRLIQAAAALAKPYGAGESFGAYHSNDAHWGVAGPRPALA